MTVRVRKGKRGTTYMLDIRHKHSDGRVERIRIACPKEVTSSKAAARYELLVLTDLENGVDPRARQFVVAPATTRSVPTLAAFAEDYLSNCDATNRPQYARKKRQIFETHLLPAFGPMRLDAIGVRTIVEFRSARRDPDDEDAIGEKWTNEIVGVLLHALRTAQAWEFIDKVPKVKALRVPPNEFDFLSFDEADRLVAAARRDGGPWAAMIMTGIRAGLRVGELRGLRWRDVDLVAGRIVVRVAADERDELHPPKNGRTREVPLSDDLLAELKQHRHLRAHVFDQENGTILSHHHCRTALDRITRRAGLRDIGWHVLRHTFASHLAMTGATLKEVQELGGWQTISMVLRYAHLSPDAKRETVRRLDRGHKWARVPGSTSTNNV